ncbi:GNAT family N-acetyltransferase [Phenylobacterium sp.]|uniref:GNAT family N-acetyltransferase n=1 Tax=Phenylobacterium sp. TaxID=1871053 RepID=UPI0025E42163|nr:GNAT family N-acetyltransferase [Phenylobacterium sp.]
MPTVTLEPCVDERRPSMDAMFQLYVHDFSEHWAGLDRGELEEDGRFEDYPGLERYWVEPGRSAWFIRVNGHLAGFALLSASSHSGEPADHDVAEFFVVRKHRRGGVGFAAARQLISARRGQWEIAVVKANIGALAFWRRVAAAMAAGEVDEQWVDDERWNGAILRFVIA